VCYLCVLNENENEMNTTTTVANQERAKKRAKLKELTAKVKELLITDVRYRENDALLVNRIQRDEMIYSGLNVDGMTLNDFFRIRLQKRVSSGDSITRIRREVQEYYAETRGDNYKKRQSKQVDVVGDLHEVEDDINRKKAAEYNKKNTPISSTPTIVEECELCQGAGEYEGFPCNVCGGIGEVQFK